MADVLRRVSRRRWQPHQRRGCRGRGTRGLGDQCQETCRCDTQHCDHIRPATGQTPIPHGRHPSRRHVRSSPLCHPLRRRCTLLAVRSPRTSGHASLLVFVWLTEGRDERWRARRRVGQGEHHNDGVGDLLGLGHGNGRRGEKCDRTPSHTTTPTGSRTWLQNRSEAVSQYDESGRPRRRVRRASPEEAPEAQDRASPSRERHRRRRGPDRAPCE